MGGQEQDAEIDDEDRALLSEVLDLHYAGPGLPDRTSFRAAHANARVRLDKLEEKRLLASPFGRYQTTISGLQALRSPRAKIAYERCNEFLGNLRSVYLESQEKAWNVEAFGERFERSTEEASRILTLLLGVQGFICHQFASETGFVSIFSLREVILDAVLPSWPEEEGSETSTAQTRFEPFISSIEISGYRPFLEFSAEPGQLTVIIGANATGKSSLFDALRLLAYAAESPFPLEIDSRNGMAATLFHAGGPEQIDLAVTTPFGPGDRLRYEVSISGPKGSPRVVRERLATQPLGTETTSPFAFVDFHGGKGFIRNGDEHMPKRSEWSVPPNELALRRTLDPTLVTPSRFREFVASWRFYAGFDVSPEAAMRRPAYIDENPVLAEDGSNLTAVLNSFVLEHSDAWEELEAHLRATIPAFEAMGVRPRGVRGMAIGTWRERGIRGELALGDLSEGTLRLLCWLVLAFSPNLPPVICIDEPELGLHPRVLPLLAGAFKVASARSQILIATHSPHFLSQFELDEIAVMRKEDGRATFVRPATSQALRHEVEELGGEALASLFLSGELEVLP
jgi:predicted ATPase